MLGNMTSPRLRAPVSLLAPVAHAATVIGSLLVIQATGVQAQVIGPALTPIAVTGDPSPDGDGALNILGTPSINDQGDVSFAATLTGTLSPSGLFVDFAASGLVAVARPGDPAPDGNGTFIGFTTLPLPLNASGEIAFRAGLNGSTGGTADNTGIFVLGNTDRTIVRKGQPSPDANGEFDVFDDIGIEDIGSVSFWALIANTAGGALVDDRGAFRGAGTVGEGVPPVDQVIRMGDLEGPTGPIVIGNVPADLASHPDGWMAVRAFIEDPTAGTSDLALFVVDGSMRTRRVTTGDPSPDGDGNVFGFPLPFIGSDGAVGVPLDLNGSSAGQMNDSALGSYSATGIDLLLAREDDSGPIDGAFNGDFEDTLGFASTLVAPSRLVFQAFLTGTTGGSADETGLFLATPVDVVQVVREGQLTPDMDGEFDDFRFQRAHVNPAECVLFYADVRNETTLGAGLFRYRPNTNLTTLARIGQSFLGSTIQSIDVLDQDSARLAGLSPMNSSCEVSFGVRLADNRRVIVAVPEPHFGALGIAMLSTLTCLARRRSTKGATRRR